MARDLAIDLGTANTLVYARGQGIVLNEPTVIALNSRTGDVLAMGHEAWQMIGRTPSYIVAVRPLRQGAITDFDITQRMIRLLLQRVGVNRFNRPRVVICVPSAITAVERRAVTEAARRAGAADAQLIEQPMAAAIGAGLPINEPVGNMVVDIGGGTSETALISLGGVVALEAVRVGFVRHRRGHPGLRAPRVRHRHRRAHRRGDQGRDRVGCADRRRERAEVRGRELMSGLPKTVILDPAEVRDGHRRAGADHRRLGRLVSGPGAARAGPGPDPRGHHLVGGGAMLRGLDRRLADATDIPVRLVDAPLECVVLGAGHCIESYDVLKTMFMDARG